MFGLLGISKSRWLLNWAKETSDEPPCCPKTSLWAEQRTMCSQGSMGPSGGRGEEIRCGKSFSAQRGLSHICDYLSSLSHFCSGKCLTPGGSDSLHTVKMTSSWHQVVCVCVTSQLQTWKADLDSSLPPPLDSVVVWLQRVEAVLADERDGEGHRDAAKKTRAQQDTLKVIFISEQM